MSIRWITLMLVALNVVLVFNNGFLADAMKSLGRAQTAEERREIRKDWEKIASERAMIGTQIRKLSELLAQMLHSSRVVEPVWAADSGEFDVDAKFDEVSEEGASERPNPTDIAVLSKDEMDILRQLRKEMPRFMDVNLMLHGDVDAVLGSSSWNPEQADLDGARRAELKAYMSDYRYFARLSQMELAHKMKSEVEHLRQSGAFVEYKASERAPAIKGISLSFAEASDRPGYVRLYYFYPEDYPELYHQQRVSEQRQLETVINAYHLINDG